MARVFVMDVQVLVFGATAAAAKAPSVRVSVPSHATAATVLAALAEQHPSLRFALGSARLAINSGFAAAETRVHAEDELALIALVGGG
jgi:molybdopterin converting factor small subunit